MNANWLENKFRDFKFCFIEWGPRQFSSARLFCGTSLTVCSHIGIATLGPNSGLSGWNRLSIGYCSPYHGAFVLPENKTQAFGGAAPCSFCKVVYFLPGKERVYELASEFFL
jgi:hypothetical protein